MNINPKYLEISYEKTGIRNSQKRLTELIEDTVVEQLKEFQDELALPIALGARDYRKTGRARD